MKKTHDHSVIARASPTLGAGRGTREAVALARALSLGSARCAGLCPHPGHPTAVQGAVSDHCP